MRFQPAVRRQSLRLKASKRERRSSTDKRYAQRMQPSDDQPPIKTARPSSGFALHVIALALTVLASLIFSAPKSFAISIELKAAASDRIERQRLAAAGQLPLAGTPNLSQRNRRLNKKGLKFGAPVLIRIFKQESELELWMAKDNKYVLFATYPVCSWSGGLGPKILEGDRQSPEGFYTLTRRALHRSGRWPRSLNLGFPNVYDRSLSRTGSYILLHGGCASTGCFAMTNAVMEEIFQLTEAALKAGQRHAQVHVFPFRMTDKNLAKHSSSQWFDFWGDLKAGYQAFEKTHRPLEVSVCKGRYSARASRPEEVAAEHPLAPCGETVARLEAETLLEKIADHPVRWQKLNAREKWILKEVQAANAQPSPALLKEKGYKKQARARLKKGKRRHRNRAAGITPRIKCSLKRASCRKFVALMRKRIARKLANASKTKTTRRSKSKRRKRSAQRQRRHRGKKL